VAKILVTDDSLFLRGRTCAILNQAGHETIEAANGDQCLEIVAIDPPDILFLDLVMPDLDGFAVLKALQDAGFKLPVIVLTADIQDGVKKECHRLGAVALIHKPPKENEVLAALDAALNPVVTTLDDTELTPQQRDLIAELIHIGVGHAASTLHSLIGHKITLVVPEVCLITLDSYQRSHPEIADQLLSTVSMDFRGSFDGSASLMFPTDSAHTLVSALTGEYSDSPRLDELRAGTLAEVGNILLNGVMGSISNTLNIGLSYFVPDHIECPIAHIFLRNNAEADTVLQARTVFSINDLEVTGNILLFFKLESCSKLINAVNRELAQ